MWCAGLLCRVWGAADEAAGDRAGLPILLAHRHTALHAAPRLQCLQQVCLPSALPLPLTSALAHALLPLSAFAPAVAFALVPPPALGPALRLPLPPALALAPAVAAALAVTPPLPVQLLLPV